MVNGGGTKSGRSDSGACDKNGVEEEGTRSRALSAVAEKEPHTSSTHRGVNKPGSVEAGAIASLSLREQVDALAQALLREFMHRRGYTKTLQTFDRECPRTDRTISSRQLMRQLLEIPSQAFPSLLSSVNGESIGERCKQPKKDANREVGEKKKVPPTLMEELCSYRLQKREVLQRQQQQNETLSAGNDSQTTIIVDPSDAEIEEWRAAAAERERRIAETNARHEQLLQVLHKKKKKERKLTKLRKEMEGEEEAVKRKKKNRDEEQQHDSEVDGEEEGEEVNTSLTLQRRGRHHTRYDISGDSSDEHLPTRAKSGAAQTTTIENGSLAEPEFLLGTLEKRKAAHASGHAVGSHWTPCGGSVNNVGLDRQLPHPLKDDDTATARQPPSFLFGEGMSRMSDRMQVARKKNSMEEWHPSPLGVVSEKKILGDGGPRGSACFTSGVLGSWKSSPHQTGREDSLSSKSSCFSNILGRRTLGSDLNLVAQNSPPSHDGSSSLVMVPPPPPGAGILKTGGERASRGYNEMARPSASALRKDSGLGLGKDNSSELEPSARRKGRRVTILMD